jgi:hypothetical protein
VEPRDFEPWKVLWDGYNAFYGREGPTALPEANTRKWLVVWQIATYNFSMAKSIRITDELYELATQEAALMHRSLAQQIEHWVKLGVGVEHANGATVDDVRAAALRYRQARDEAAVRSGRKKASSLHVIPASLIKNARIDSPRAVFSTGRKTW